MSRSRLRSHSLTTPALRAIFTSKASTRAPQQGALFQMMGVFAEFERAII
jgi:hypothetical protein